MSSQNTSCRCKIVFINKVFMKEVIKTAVPCMCVCARLWDKKTIKERIYIRNSLRVAINHARVWCTVMEPLTSLNTWKWRQLPPNRRDFLIFCAISCAAHQLQPQKLLYSSTVWRDCMLAETGEPLFMASPSWRVVFFPTARRLRFMSPEKKSRCSWKLFSLKIYLQK